MAEPRSTITPDAFVVAPQLIGLPLATPRRRAMAMLIDLALVAIMVKSISAMFLPLAAGVLFLRAKPIAGTLRRPRLSRAFRFVGALMIIVFVMKALGSIGGIDNLFTKKALETDTAVQGDTSARGDVQFNLRDLRALPALEQFTDAENEEEARAGAEALASWVRGRSDDPAERTRAARLALRQLKDEEFFPLIEAELRPLAGDTASASVNTASLTGYAAALEAGDTAKADSLKKDVVETVAGDELARLKDENADLRDELSEARDKLDNDEPGGIRGFISGIADDLGFGFGWMALYFTFFLAWMKGQTPGKRVMKVRVIRLDARPISWWISFERFGGYAASLSIGLLGFLQILWDRNRQGLHDKAVETVVVKVLTGDPVVG
jgi:hypothetical protein